MKLIKRALVSAIATVALAIAPAVSAEAAVMKFDVTKLSAKSVVVSNFSCRNVEIDMTHKKSGVGRWYVDAELSKAGSYIGSAYYASGGDKSRARVFVCPSVEGLGKYTIGPSDIDASASSGWDYLSKTDYTKGSLYVRGKSFASLSTKRSGSTVSLTSTSKVYNPEKYGKVNYNPKVKFQVKSGSKWKTIKTVTAKKGKATYKLKSKSKKTYRATFSQISWATGATSKSVKR